MRTAVGRSLSALFGAALVLLLLGGEARPAAVTIHSVPAGGDQITEGTFEQLISARPIPIVAPPKPDRRALPSGARALFPSFVGDSVFVTLRPRVIVTQTGAQVFKSTITPLLRSLRFSGTGSKIAIPSGPGTRLARGDLATIAGVTCREFAALDNKGYQRLCAVMEGRAKPDAAIERIFQNGEGESFEQFKADIERLRIQYVFPQVIGRVPIEHSGLIAGRWEGETVTEVSGTIFTRFVVANSVKLPFAAAATVARKQLIGMKGVRGVDKRAGSKADLVLLPWGGKRASAGFLPALRYAYRVLLTGQVAGMPAKGQATWLAWIDAQTGKLLALIPQFDFSSSASLPQWRRAADVAVQTGFGQVDSSSGGQYTLQLSGVINRIDRLGNGTFGDGEVSISDSSGGSSSSFANFNQAPVNDGANAGCQAGGNTAFRQSNDFSHLYGMRSLLVGAGTIPSFPEQAITVWIDVPGDSNWSSYGASSETLNFGLAAGFSDPACPNAVNTKMNGSTDATTLIHELGHLSTKRIQERRPANWCGMATCAIPIGYVTIHDLADAMSHAYASINCMGGWSRHSETALNASLNCVGNTSEAGWLPRLSQVTVPFNPTSPGDHFPEHRLLGAGDYADMQIVAAALWAVRQGMRSKCLPSGTPQYFVRLIRAMWNAGFLTTTCANCDRDLYRLIQDLEKQMAQQWATAGQPGGPPGFFHNGNHTTNKLTGGFARAGVFLVPYQCIDGDPTTTDASFCPGGENGGDAVVDIDDNSTANDVTIDGVVHPTYDYLLRTNAPPTFLVWTGPRYKFDASGTATGYTPSAATPSPCYVQYQVELSNASDFSSGVITSTPGSGAWRTVSTTSAPECYGTWTPNSTDWNMLKGASGETRVYYRVRTRNAAGDAATERISTSPGNGLFNVPAPYAIVNDTGTP